MQASLESSVAIKRRRVPIKIIEPSSAAASTTSPAVPVPSPSNFLESPVVEPSSRAVRPVSSNAGSDTLEPESSHSLKLSAMDASSRKSKVSLTTGTDLTDDKKKESPEGSRTTSLTPTVPSSANNSTSGASKQNSFKDAKQARESAKPSRVGGGIFRTSGSSTVFTPRDNVNPTLADPPSFPVRLSAKDDSNSKTSYMPVPKAPNTLFDFVKSWGSLGSTEEKWQLINVSYFFLTNDDSFHHFYYGKP
jgi:RNA polymerase II-associated protein 3